MPRDFDESKFGLKPKKTKFTPEQLDKFRTKLKQLRNKLMSFSSIGVHTGYTDQLLEKFLDAFDDMRKVSSEINSFENLELIRMTNVAEANFEFYAALYNLEKWKNFDYDSAKFILHNFAEKRAVEADREAINGMIAKFPKGLEQSKKSMEDIKNKANKLPTKKLKLEDWINGKGTISL